MWYVCCYDIHDSRQRDRVARLLDDHGDRIQYSVFEVNLEPGQLDPLIAKLRARIDPSRDSVYFFPICGRCRVGTVVCGQGSLFDDELVWIV